MVGKNAYKRRSEAKGSFGTYFTPCSNVYIVNFEHEIAAWVTMISSSLGFFWLSALFPFLVY